MRTALQRWYSIIPVQTRNKWLNNFLSRCSHSPSLHECKKLINIVRLINGICVSEISLEYHEKLRGKTVIQPEELDFRSLNNRNSTTGRNFRCSQDAGTKSGGERFHPRKLHGVINQSHLAVPQPLYRCNTSRNAGLLVNVNWGRNSVEAGVFNAKSLKFKCRCGKSWHYSRYQKPKFYLQVFMTEFAKNLCQSVFFVVIFEILVVCFSISIEL